MVIEYALDGYAKTVPSPNLPQHVGLTLPVKHQDLIASYTLNIVYSLCTVMCFAWGLVTVTNDEAMTGTAEDVVDLTACKISAFCRKNSVISSNQ